MYSERLVELFHSRAHAGRVEDATHYGEAGTPGRGPYTRLWLRIRDGVIEAAGYQAYGCPAIIGCMEALCAAVHGSRAADFPEVTPEQLLVWTDGLPEGKEHCPALAAQAWQSLEELN
jgi:NifU-like protein